MKEVTQRIRNEISILDYLQEKGFHPIKEGHYYRLKEHSSFVYTPRKELWNWNSRGLRGSIIDLYMLLEGVNQKRAICELRSRLSGAPPHKTKPKETERPTRSDMVTNFFALPTRHPQFYKNIYAYLIQTRRLNPDVVRWLVARNIIYPAERGNLCYWSASPDGRPNYAALKSTSDQSQYRHVVGGSNCLARFTVNMDSHQCKKLFVVEAAMDAFSIMTLLQRAGIDYTRYAFLSLECCCAEPLFYHIGQHPEITTIYLAQDNDDAGHQSRLDCRDGLALMGFGGTVIDKIPELKDWNEILKAEARSVA